MSDCGLRGRAGYGPEALVFFAGLAVMFVAALLLDNYDVVTVGILLVIGAVGSALARVAGSLVRPSKRGQLFTASALAVVLSVVMRVDREGYVSVIVVPLVAGAVIGVVATAPSHGKRKASSGNNAVVGGDSQG